MVARAIRHVINAEANPRIEDIVDAALDPVRADAEMRARHHLRWGLGQLGGGIAFEFALFAVGRMWLDPSSFWIHEGRAIGYLVMVWGLINLARRRTYNDLRGRLTVHRTVVRKGPDDGTP